LRLNMPTPEGRASMTQFKKEISDKWPMVHTDDIDEILGVSIVRINNTHIQCTQPAELEKVQDIFFNNETAPEVRIPLHPDILSSANESDLYPDDDGNQPADETSYRSKLGKLQYLRVTRLDIIYTLSVLAERSHIPTMRDMRGLYWLAAYLITTRDAPLSFHAGEGRVNEHGVMTWSLYSDCSWGTRRNSYSCMGYLIINGDMSEEESRTCRPFTAPVVCKTKKESGPPSDSASAGELNSTVLVIKNGISLRGMSEEVAGIDVPLSLDPYPEGNGGPSPMLINSPSPLLTDNASNVRALAVTTSKKPKGLRQWSRELSYARHHAEHGTVDIIGIPAPQQRANPLTKALRSPSVHWTEAEWLLGSSDIVNELQKTAYQQGIDKRSTRTGLNDINRFAGSATLVRRPLPSTFTDFITHLAHEEVRFMGTEEETDIDTVYNTHANAVEGTSTKQLRTRLRKHKQENDIDKQDNKQERKSTTRSKFEGDYNDGTLTFPQLADIIFQTPEAFMDTDSDGEKVLNVIVMEVENNDSSSRKRAADFF
jgi:hypothetical protein